MACAHYVSRFTFSASTTIPASTLGLLSALLSSLVWGSGDFLGGVASRRSNQYQALTLAAISGASLMGVLMLARGEAWPSAANAFWAAASGFSGALGIAALYRGLAMGNAATVAPLAAVISAALPALYGVITAGLLPITGLIGFAVALAGIWLVSQSDSAGAGGSRLSFTLALFAGLGFGGFFVLMAFVQSDAVFAPLFIARLATLAAALLMLFVRRVPFPAPRRNAIALVGGMLDAGGNIFFYIALQLTRVDIAAVLSSLYPAATVMLSWLILKERISRAQWFGAALCLLAVILIAYKPPT